MGRGLLAVLFVLAVAGCRNPITPGSTGALEIRDFRVGSVTSLPNGVSTLTFSYGVTPTAVQCAVFLFKGTEAIQNNQVGGGEVPVSPQTTQELLFRSAPGQYLLEMRCVSSPGAQTGAVEKRFFSI